MLPILLVAALSIAVSFTCSLLEAALYSVPESKVRRMAEEGRRGATRLLKLKLAIDRPISAILTFNTIANTIGGTILGALAAKEYGAESPVVLVIASVFTVAILICSEIIPKTLGVVFADRVAPLGSVVIDALIFLLYPFVRLSEYVTSRIRTAGSEQKQVTEADLLASAKIAAQEGTILPEEARWVANALALNEKSAHDIMTPRTVVYSLPSKLPLSMISMHSEHWKHSRIPLSENNDPDQIVGIVYRREIFDAMLSLEESELAGKRLDEFRHDVQFIPETLRGNVVLERFLGGREHLFVVTNEHGGMEGIITLEDVIEEMLGQEIVDEHDRHDDMQAYARKMAEKRRGGAAPKP